MKIDEVVGKYLGEGNPYRRIADKYRHEPIDKEMNRRAKEQGTGDKPVKQKEYEITYTDEDGKESKGTIKSISVDNAKFEFHKKNPKAGNVKATLKG
jgi:hypothetical protein